LKFTAGNLSELANRSEHNAKMKPDFPEFEPLDGNHATKIGGIISGSSVTSIDLSRIRETPKFLFLSLVLLAGITQVSANPAMEWIEKMSDSMRNLSYQGEFVYLHENQLESMSILHIKDEFGERERLLSLNGEAREVIRDNKNLTCIWPASRKVVVDNVRQKNYSPLFVPEDIARLSKYYNMNLADGDRVAGQDSIIVHIKPKDQLRYGLKLWINSSNGLLLKSNLINELHEVVEVVMFTNLKELNKIDRMQLITMPELDDSFSLIQYHSGDASGNLEVDMTWRFSNLPDGFWQESAVKRRSAETDQFIQQMIYTDGLASLSVFIEKQTLQAAQGETSMGAVNGFIRILNNYSVTAIGAVPALTVRRMAESVYLQP
jgi:sigma-E factor negative regulatory protein RseB